MAFVAPLLPYITAAVAVAGAVTAVQQGRAAKAAGEVNKRIAAEQASAERRQTLLQAVQQDRENYLRLGSIRAAHGKSGGVADEGSVIDVLGDAVAQGELQKQIILERGGVRASALDATGERDLRAGRNAQRASLLTAGQELLTGAQNVNRLSRNSESVL